MTMEHPRKLIHTTLIPIRWGDMDAFGHVNNTVYFRYAEQARIEWLDAHRLVDRSAAGELPEVMPVIVNASCTFIIPMTAPGTVEVRMAAGEPGRSSLPTFYEMRIVGDDRLYAEGAAKIVWTSPATGKSVPVPERVRQLLAASAAP
jgi:acyl-CoA thioester hydrolase